MADVQQLVTDLNAGWYNEVVKALNLDPTTFQLTQGTLGLQTTDSSGLFLISDAVPPPAAVGFFDAGGMVKRSQAYGELLEALQPEGGSDLPTVLGDMYASWMTYRNAYFDNPSADLSQQQLFQRWANGHLDPRTAEKAETVFAQAANAPLLGAIDAYTAKGAKQTFVNSAGTTYSLYTYTATVQAATQAIQNGSGATISFDSTSMDTTLSHTTADGSASGFYDIFSAGAGASFDQLNETAAGSALTIEGTIGSYATLVTEAGSWFDAEEVSRAYNAQNDMTVWDPAANAGNWDSFFGQPNGSLARRVSQLLLVSDYQITVTSEASYSENDLTQITTSASGGIWPFFSVSASATQTTQATLDSAGHLVVTHTLPKGLIQIWGVTVENAPN